MAVDVGGTTIKGAVVNSLGRTLAQRARPTPTGRGPAAVLRELEAVIAELRAEHQDTRAIGVVVPGLVDAAAGIAEFSANLGFRRLPLRSLIEQATGLPVVLDHDVRAAGVAARSIGVISGQDDCLLVVIGTGIAAVSYTGGRQLRGATGIAGELGHIPVWPDGEPCPCGQRGCLERYASASAISRRYAELSGRHELPAEEISARCAGDQLAARVWSEATAALAIALATCTMLLDPAVIVIAGGLSEAGAALLDPVRDQLTQRLRWREPPALVLSPLGGRAGQLGAAVLGWRSLGLNDFRMWQMQPSSVHSNEIR